MSKKGKITGALIVILTVEKILQHLLTALAFLGLFSSAAIPYIGPNFSISNRTMTLFNLIYTLLFIIGLFGRIRLMRWGMPLILALVALDIILEFLFHGLGYITVSVIVSTVLIITIIVHGKGKKSFRHSGALNPRE